MSMLGETRKSGKDAKKLDKLPKLTIQQQIDNQEVI